MHHAAFPTSPAPRCRNPRGVVLPTLLFIFVLVLLAAGALELSLQSFKYSHRNDVRARARTVAESELEYIYFTFEDLLITGKAKTAEDIPRLLADVCDHDATPSTPRKPFALMHRGLDSLDPDPGFPKEDWIVMRSLVVSQSSIEGIIPDSNGKQGSFSYLNARIMVTPGPSSPLYNKLFITFGRRFSYATASIFQYNVFSQGDLEFNPGGNTVIEGDIAANGSVYMGSTSGNLTVKGYVRYLNGGYFNATGKTDDQGALLPLPEAGDEDSSTYFSNGDQNFLNATTFRKPGTLIGNTLVTATDSTVVWNDDGPLAVTSNNLIAPTFTMSQATQVTEMKSAENLLGGLDARSLAQNNNDLFGETPVPEDDASAAAIAAAAAKLEAAMNNVYRSLIAPPPSAVYAATGSTTDTSASEYPSGTDLANTADNPEIAALRAYNRAGLIITVTSSGGVPHIVVTGKDGTNFTPNLSSVLSSSTLHDLREGKNIPITQIDVGALGAAIKDNPALNDSFNGLLYIHLANSSSAAPAAVRLVNAEKTPGYETASGFSVATNGGLYVQGNYNTVTKEGGYAVDETNTGTLNPTMLMADSITVLSKDWSDANSANPDITSRPANTTTVTEITPAVVVDGVVVTPAVTTSTTAGANLVVNAGILTGNVSATENYVSGGGQNLVRYLENWNVDIDTGANGRTVRLNGSIGRLFDSRHYVTPFQQPAQFNSVTGKNEGAYRTPSLRTFAFNDTLKKENARPPGSPIIPYFDRGNFFSSEIN